GGDAGLRACHQSADGPTVGDHVDRQPFCGGAVMRRKRGANRRGFFLILVLVVIDMANMAAFSFTALMVAYDESAYLSVDRGQADLLVESGVEAVRIILAQPPSARNESGGVYSNPSLFQAINDVPGMDASMRGNFTILAPAMDETGQI